VTRKRKSVKRNLPTRSRRGALSRGQSEQLIVLLEEAAEVIQVSAKILRFGLRSHSPLDPTRTRNNTLLQNEIGDFEGVVENLKMAGFGITTQGIRKARDAKRRRMQHWLMTRSTC
jgi:hypothetical protein